MILNAHQLNNWYAVSNVNDWFEILSFCITLMVLNTNDWFEISSFHTAFKCFEYKWLPLALL